MLCRYKSATYRLCLAGSRLAPQCRPRGLMTKSAMTVEVAMARLGSVILALRQYPQGGATTRQTNQPYSPSPLMTEESKPVPVPDTGAEGENDASASSQS